MYDLIVIALLVLVAYFTGSYLERRHYKSIRKREAFFLQLPTLTSKTAPSDQEIERVMLVHGSVAISMDYFKRFVMGFKHLFGGRLGMYETLIDRGRREAILRMKENAQWADVVVNLRIETSAIGGQGARSNKNRIRSIELFAYGTAIKYRS